jgi:hypothetical protein
VTRLTVEQLQAYLLRSYTAVDGLWFMQAEKQWGFDAALELDRQVWAVMPKIQARQLKESLKAEPNLAGLAECLGAKLELDGFQFGIQWSETELLVQIHFCPWQDKIEKAGRGHLGAQIASVICPAEYAVWAEEFGCRFLPFNRESVCASQASCLLRFVPA